MTLPQMVLSFVALILLAGLLFLDLKYIRDSRRIAKGMNLPQGQWLRLAKTLAFDPVIDILVVGVVLGKDVIQNWEHLVVAVVGAAAGLLVGHYRFRIQYVRAVPEQKAIVFVRSRAEYVALIILTFVSFATEQHEIPVVGPLTLLITLGLALVVFEAIGRAWFSYRQYKKDSAAVVPLVDVG
jgi:hypothetical protein